MEYILAIIASFALSFLLSYALDNDLHWSKWVFWILLFTFTAVSTPIALALADRYHHPRN